MTFWSRPLQAFPSRPYTIDNGMRRTSPHAAPPPKFSILAATCGIGSLLSIGIRCWGARPGSPRTGGEVLKCCGCLHERKSIGSDDNESQLLRATKACWYLLSCSRFNVGIVFANADTELLVPRFWSALIDRSLGALLYLQQICLEYENGASSRDPDFR